MLRANCATLNLLDVVYYKPHIIFYNTKSTFFIHPHSSTEDTKCLRMKLSFHFITLSKILYVERIWNDKMLMNGLIWNNCMANKLPWWIILLTNKMLGEAHMQIKYIVQLEHINEVYRAIACRKNAVWEFKPALQLFALTTLVISNQFGW